MQWDLTCTGCKDKLDDRPVWDCLNYPACPDGSAPRLLYAWGEGGPTVDLPDGIGFKLGQGTSNDYVTLQVYLANGTTYRHTCRLPIGLQSVITKR